MCLFKMPQENKIILFYRDCEHYDSLENEKGSTRDRREPLFKNMKTTKLRQCCQLLKCSIRYKGSPWTDQFNDFLGFMFSHWENTKLKHATLNTALFLQKALTLIHFQSGQVFKLGQRRNTKKFGRSKMTASRYCVQEGLRLPEVFRNAGKFCAHESSAEYTCSSGCTVSSECVRRLPECPGTPSVVPQFARLWLLRQHQ